LQGLACLSHPDSLAGCPEVKIVRARSTTVLVILALTAIAAGPPIRVPHPLRLLSGAPKTPPPASTSHYMQTIDPDVAYDLGCQMGRGVDAGTQPARAMVVLDFGMPVSFGAGSYGASLFSAPAQRTTEIRIAAQEMAHGYFVCTVGIRPKLTVGIGTSNYGPDVSYDHGRAWGGMVNRANEILRQKGWSLQATIVGASDIELSWSSPTVARRWEDGYATATDARLLNFGDAAGCPPAGSSCGTSAHPEWEQSDVWNVSWGHPPAMPLPEIYLNNGVMAEQWHQVARTGLKRSASAMEFAGSMTQYAACREMGCDSSTDNTPSQGWTQLYDSLNVGDGTDQTPPFSTDISWRTGTAAHSGTATPQDAVWPAGILPDGEFPSSSYDFVNRWTGTVEGGHVTVYAGSLARDPALGVVLVVTASRDLRAVRGMLHSSGRSTGPLRIVGHLGGRFELRAADGSTLSFDVRSGRLASVEAAGRPLA
jgi:hypothetical protein